jgi:hypothetical protein
MLHLALSQPEAGETTNPRAIGPSDAGLDDAMRTRLLRRPLQARA